ncbi:MAG: hypothetical protein ISS23_03915 [Nanoarchaeota archaeon]|nr:hypothetical protein [Nanoarchaeota archaeon]
MKSKKTVPELERLAEVRMMCSRPNPLYERIDNFSIALYVLGHFEDVPDFLSLNGLDTSEASEILKENFEEINFEDIPEGYNIRESKERYLLVIGDLVFPRHFAFVVDPNNERPFFSKLDHIGSGYDSLVELMENLSDEGKIGLEDVHYFRQV